MKKIPVIINLISIIGMAVSLIIFFIFLINAADRLFAISAVLMLIFGTGYAISKKINDKNFRYNPLASSLLYKFCEMNGIKRMQEEEIIKTGREIFTLKDLPPEEIIEAYKEGKKIVA